MDVSRYVVRAPVVQDAEALGRVHCAVWRATYADEMTASAYGALLPERFEAGWRRRLSSDRPAEERGDNGPPAEITRLAEHPDDGVVGFISVGPARDVGAPTGTQLWSLNLLPEHTGTGLADLFMRDVLGEGPAYLWVAAGNARAIRFYQRHAFLVDGAETFDDRDGITEIRMTRRG